MVSIGTRRRGAIGRSRSTTANVVMVIVVGGGHGRSAVREENVSCGDLLMCLAVSRRSRGTSGKFKLCTTEQDRRKQGSLIQYVGIVSGSIQHFPGIPAGGLRN